MYRLDRTQQETHTSKPRGMANLQVIFDKNIKNWIGKVKSTKLYEMTILKRN